MSNRFSTSKRPSCMCFKGQAFHILLVNSRSTHCLTLAGSYCYPTLSCLSSTCVRTFRKVQRANRPFPSLSRQTCKASPGSSSRKNTVNLKYWYDRHNFVEKIELGMYPTMVFILQLFPLCAKLCQRASFVRVILPECLRNFGSCSYPHTLLLRDVIHKLLKGTETSRSASYGKLQVSKSGQYLSGFRQSKGDLLIRQ
jgi:hypothetical protein